MNPAKPGLILFAHGARDPRWAIPFEAVAERVRAARPGVPVRLAFLEFMAPNLPEYAVLFHGVVMAGGTITTINPTYTAPEVHHQLTDAGADLLVTIPMFLEVATEGARGTGVDAIFVLGEATGGAFLVGRNEKPGTTLS